MRISSKKGKFRSFKCRNTLSIMFYFLLIVDFVFSMDITEQHESINTKIEEKCKIVSNKLSSNIADLNRLDTDFDKVKENLKEKIKKTDILDSTNPLQLQEYIQAFAETTNKLKEYNEKMKRLNDDIVYATKYLQLIDEKSAEE